MKNLIGLIVLASFLAGVSVTRAQFIPFSGAGARAMGNGGAFIGNADDATAIYWNPAGLTQLKKGELSLMGIFTNFKEEISDESFDPTSKSRVGMNFGSIVVPLSPGGANFVIGVGRLEAFSSLDVKKDSGGELLFKYSLYNTMISVAVELGNVISVGVTGNMIDGQVTESNDGYAWYINGTNIYEGKSKFIGDTFLTYGVLAKLGPPIRVGAFLRQPMKYKEEGVSGVREDAEWNVVYPGGWGVGTAIRAGDNFTLSVDLNTVRWSKAIFGDYHLREKEFDTTSGLFVETEDLAEDQMSVRIGLEYLVGGTGLPMPIRVGTFAENENLTDSDGERIKTRWWTFGLGMLGPTTQLDLAILAGTLKAALGSDAIETDTTLKILASVIVKFK